MGRFRPPVRLPWTSSLASSTAMKRSFSYRRTAWCICGMSRPTALPATSGRCRTGHQTCALAHQFPADLGLAEDDDDWGEWTHSGLRSHDDRRRPRSPSVPPGRHVTSSTSRTDPLRIRLTAFSFVFAPRHHRCAAITLCFALAVGLKKLPYGSMMFFTTLCGASLSGPSHMGATLGNSLPQPYAAPRQYHPG